MNIWNLLLYQPLINLLVACYQVLFQNLGLAILGVTLVTNILLFPLTIPSLRLQRKQKELKDELDDLRKKHKDDKKKFAEEQMKLYQEHGVHPAQGCLPQILRIVILIALYQAFNQVLHSNGGGIEALNGLLYFPWLHIDPIAGINSSFLYLDLAQKDPFYILPILAGAAQFALSKVMAISSQIPDGGKKKDQKESPEDMAANMQKQMGFIMPIMTVVIMVSLPSGLTLYWFFATVVSLIQQVLINRSALWPKKN